MASTVCVQTGTMTALSLPRPFEFGNPSSTKLISLWKSILPLQCGVSKLGGEKRSRHEFAARASFTPYRDADSRREDREAETDTRELLCCPVCFQPLRRDGPAGFTLDAIKRSRFSCKRCRKGFSNTDAYLDLTILDGSKLYDEISATGAELFRNPLVSFLYERGWRDSFPVLADFPGPDAELKMAQEYFKPVAGGVLIDVSCGSGLFARRFARTGDYAAVIASDYSENMLRQTDQFIKQDASLATSNIALVRADVARLPFATGSIDAVHAGAALHCWPSPAAGMAEISRILKPGGIFVGTTLVNPFQIVDFGNKNIRKAIKQALLATPLRYWEELELEDLCGSCGLVQYSEIRRGRFIMISAKRSTD